MQHEAWLDLLGADPRPWLLASDEPGARWSTLTDLLDRRADDPEVRAVHEAVLADRGTADLIGRLGSWEEEAGASGHHSPKYPPNLLQLLADLGVTGGEIPAVDEILDGMLAHQDGDGRFQAFGRVRGTDDPIWGSLLCDTHAITEVLVRFGRGEHPAVLRSLRRMGDDLAETAQGRAWPCFPDPGSGFRGPGRKNDVCPQVTLEALRTFARVPADLHPPALVEAARVSLRVWRNRTEEKPYMFGHGYRFKTVKWPAFWYDLHWVLDTLGRYPALWEDGPAEDRRSLAEMVACLIAYNFGADGTVTPHSCYQGFETFSFGQKKRPSAFASARLAGIVRRFNDLAGDIAAIDVTALTGSKGGSGTPVPPRN